MNQQKSSASCWQPTLLNTLSTEVWRMNIRTCMIHEVDDIHIQGWPRVGHLNVLHWLFTAMMYLMILISSLSNSVGAGNKSTRVYYCMNTLYSIRNQRWSHSLSQNCMSGRQLVFAAFILYSSASLSTQTRSGAQIDIPSLESSHWADWMLT